MRPSCEIAKSCVKSCTCPSDAPNAPCLSPPRPAGERLLAATVAFPRAPRRLKAGSTNRSASWAKAASWNAVKQALASGGGRHRRISGRPLANFLCVTPPPPPAPGAPRERTTWALEIAYLGSEFGRVHLAARPRAHGDGLAQPRDRAADRRRARDDAVVGRAHRRRRERARAVHLLLLVARARRGGVAPRRRRRRAGAGRAPPTSRAPRPTRFPRDLLGAIATVRLPPAVPRRRRRGRGGAHRRSARAAARRAARLRCPRPRAAEGQGHAHDAARAQPRAPSRSCPAAPRAPCASTSRAIASCGGWCARSSPARAGWRTPMRPTTRCSTPPRAATSARRRPLHLRLGCACWARRMVIQSRHITFSKITTSAAASRAARFAPLAVAATRFRRRRHHRRRRGGASDRGPSR